MQFTFLDMTGKTLFLRDDAERAQWTVEEHNLELLFPYNADKVASIGQRIFFIDPATGSHQIYEIKQAKTYEPDNYQEIVAEHICISELSDEHIEGSDIENKTCSATLAQLLTGTLWSVGSVKVNPVSSVSISRGSVYQAILQVISNWNVYIEPRVTLAANGTITRYLDILSTDGVWNGLRLSVDKNMLDPSVTFDDSNVYTALFGYGGTITSSSTTEENKECTFEDVVWTATAQHPAKPKGQKYLLDPTATELYGRNGRARFGYYQNSDITDPETLLQKTWEKLQTVSTPDISIEGSIADLYRLGYVDKPIRLHDIALVEVLPIGYKKQVQIIRLTVDLLDPSATTVTIGSYIPNIIYIEKKTNESATGSSGGGGGNTGDDGGWREFRTTIEQINNGTALRFQSVQNDINHQEKEIAVQTGRIDVAYNKITAEVEDRRNADNILSGRITVEANRITQEVTRASTEEGKLAGRITTEADRITAEVTRAKGAEGALSGRIDVQADRISLVVTDGANPSIKPASIVAAINGASSEVRISADHIILDGTTIANLIQTTEIQVAALTVTNGCDLHDVDCGNIDCTGIGTNGGAVSCGDLDADTLTVGNNAASWLSTTIPVLTYSNRYNFVYRSNGVDYTALGYIVGSHSTKTIYYLGRETA